MKQLRLLLIFADPVKFEESYLLNYLWAVQDDDLRVMEHLPFRWSGYPGTCKDSEGNSYTFLVCDMNIELRDEQQFAEMKADAYAIFVANTGELPLWHDQTAMVDSILKYEFDGSHVTMQLPLGVSTDGASGNTDLEFQGYGLSIPELTDTPNKGIVEWFAAQQGLQVNTIQ